MDFQQRLEKAIQRGQRSHDAAARARAEQAMGEEELKRLHSQYRLELSEHIEQCMRQLPQHFPGFRYETLVGSRGWGARHQPRRPVRRRRPPRESTSAAWKWSCGPFRRSHVLELTAKGTIRNKEIFNRSQYQMLSHVDMASFRELVDRWILEYAELYAAKG